MEKAEIRRILVPIDFSSLSRKAIDPAVNLAKITNAEITLLHVIDVLPTAAPEFYFAATANMGYEKDLPDVSNKELNKIAQIIKKKGVEKVKVLSVTGRAETEIVRVSKKIKADIIVMGTHGISGFNEFFMGSNTFRVVSHAECAVLSVHKNFTTTEFKNIIVPFTDKPHSREKINSAINMASIYGATLHVLGIDTEGSPAHVKKLVREGEQIKKIVEEFDVKCKVKVISEPYMADTVLKYAKKIKADLIIVTADMDKVSISEYFMGPFAQQIVNHSPIPVLSLRPTFNTDTIDLRFY